MKSDTIKAIFTNILFVIGVILIIIGFTQGTLTITRMFVFDKYPLNSYEETRCEFESGMSKPVIQDENATPLSDAEIKDRKEKCLVSLEYQRKVKKTEDIVGSITMLISGIALVYVFRRFISK